MSLKPDKTITVITRSESFMLLPLVLKDSLLQITRDSDIKRPAATGHDVIEIAGLVH